MARLVRNAENVDHPIVGQSNDTLNLIYFDTLSLAAGQTRSYRLEAYETALVVLSGTVDIDVEGEIFGEVGSRPDIWSGEADSVYAPVGAMVAVTARADAQLAVAGARTEERHVPFRIRPEEVEMVDVGSDDTHSHRRIFHILGQRQAGRVGRLLVSELYAEPGCWSGYPPHRHDTDDMPSESAHEELYHYRFSPGTGFGNQIVYNQGETPQSFVTRDGDTFLLDRGYHPTSTSPGHRGYIFTILAGKSQRGLVQRFDPVHAHLVETIPGIQAMRDKFR